jgi:single-strand DNA-binding protein
MNRATMMGRLTRDPEIRYGGENNMAIAKFTLAVDRRYKREGQPEADFFNMSAFGKLAEFCNNYLHKGIKVLVEGEIHNNNYTNRNGENVYGVEIIARDIEFAESKKNSASGGDGGSSVQNGEGSSTRDDDGFIDVNKNIDDDEIPFS